MREVEFFCLAKTALESEKKKVEKVIWCFALSLVVFIVIGEKTRREGNAYRKHLRPKKVSLFSIFLPDIRLGISSVAPLPKGNVVRLARDAFSV